MDICDISVVRELLAGHGFQFSKSMGQNFLIEPWALRQIAGASEADKSCGVLEIGPGIGALTAELAQRAGKVVSVELDRTLLPVLSETMAGRDNVEIMSGDILKLNLPALASERLAGLRPIVCANLPYNITTPVLTALAASCFESVTVLVQKEAAQRLSAPPGSDRANAFSLLLQYRMETSVLFEVPRESFFPQPKVTSAVLRCVRREKPAVEVADEAFFLRVIRGAFALRRKTLVNSLAATLPELEKSAVQAAIRACGLPESVRGEALTLEDFAALCRVWKQL